jgi:hypothetical protein
VFDNDVVLGHKEVATRVPIWAGFPEHGGRGTHPFCAGRSSEWEIVVYEFRAQIPIGCV